MLRFYYLLLTLLFTAFAPPALCASAGGAAPQSHVPASSTASVQTPARKPEIQKFTPFLATRVVINLPSRTLWVYSGDRIVRYFPVGVGKVGYMTPLGKFSVIRKVIDPGWENPYLPNGKLRLAPGEDNPLGTRWIGFYRRREGEYGMHGTDNPGSVGKFSSHGCVRMKVSDAEALFDLVDLGTPVEIVYQPVLIRRSGDEVRVVVYADRFHRGMPTASQLESRIRREYPGIRLDARKLRAALGQPTEKPMAVGVMPAKVASPEPETALRIPPPTPAAEAFLKKADIKQPLLNTPILGEVREKTTGEAQPLRMIESTEAVPLIK